VIEASQLRLSLMKAELRLAHQHDLFSGDTLSRRKAQQVGSRWQVAEIQLASKIA
jgi:hypothetical protein